VAIVSSQLILVFPIYQLRETYIIERTMYKLIYMLPLDPSFLLQLMITFCSSTVMGILGNQKKLIMLRTCKLVLRMQMK